MIPNKLPQYPTFDPLWDDPKRSRGCEFTVKLRLDNTVFVPPFFPGRDSHSKRASLTLRDLLFICHMLIATWINSSSLAARMNVWQWMFYQYWVDIFILREAVMSPSGLSVIKQIQHEHVKGLGGNITKLDITGIPTWIYKHYEDLFLRDELTKQSLLTLELNITKIFLCMCLRLMATDKQDLLCDCVPCAVWFTSVLIEQGRDGWEQLWLWGHWVQAVSHTYCAACLECRRKPGLTQAVADCRRSPADPKFSPEMWLNREMATLYGSSIGVCLCKAFKIYEKQPETLVES